MSNLQNRDVPENSPEYVPPTTPRAKTNGEDLNPPKTGKGAKAKVRKPSADRAPDHARASGKPARRDPGRARASASRRGRRPRRPTLKRDRSG